MALIPRDSFVQVENGARHSRHGREFCRVRARGRRRLAHVDELLRFRRRGAELSQAVLVKALEDGAFFRCRSAVESPEKSRVNSGRNTGSMRGYQALREDSCG